MNFLKKLSCAAAATLCMASAAHADVVVNNWVFNPAGTGFASGQQIKEYLDVNGNTFIQLGAGSTAGTFSFTEHAVFNILQADSNGQAFATNYNTGHITATFSATGTGNFSGNFSFSSGTINIYQDPNDDYTSANGVYGADNGNLIASFNVLKGGGGAVDASGNPLSNAQVTVFTQANRGDLAPGYFFLGDGTDLNSQSILSFAFTNANSMSNVQYNLVSEVACQFAGFTGAGCNGSAYANAPGQYFFVSNNGQFKLSQVPEPGSLALFGIAMLGAGAVSRKRARK